MTRLNLVCDHCSRTNLECDHNGFIPSVLAQDGALTIEGLACPECDCTFIVTCHARHGGELGPPRMDAVERCDEGAARDERMKRDEDADARRKCARDDREHAA
jgi:hypothetical protein